jgi:hypothetical protein
VQFSSRKTARSHEYLDTFFSRARRIANVIFKQDITHPKFVGFVQHSLNAHFPDK